MPIVFHYVFSGLLLSAGDMGFIITHILPEEQGPGPLDVPLAVALDAGLEDEGVGVEVVLRGDGAILAAAAGVLHHHRHRQGDAAEILWRTQQTLRLRHFAGRSFLL